jgi:uncharacterized membrane-anchored protein YhcB (DUF1043 family)
MQSTVGLIVCLFLPIGAFVAYVMLRRRKQDKEKQDDIAALKAELEALKEQRELASETETKPQTEEIPE